MINCGILLNQGERINIDRDTINQIFDYCLTLEEKGTPVLLLTFSGGTKLYFDSAIARLYESKEITIEEALDAMKVDSLYRNTKEIDCGTCGMIDSGHLWKQVNKEIILIDDDVYFGIKADFKNDAFEEIFY